MPVCQILDLLFGHANTDGFTRSELMALTRLHAEAAPVSGVQECANSSPHGHGPVRLGGLNADEVRIMQGVLDLEDEEAQHVMLPLDKVFSLEVDDLLDIVTMAKIMASGHSRIPVHRGAKHNIVGFILVKRLIVLDPAAPRRVGDFAHRKPHVFAPDLRLMDALNVFLGVYCMIVRVYV